MFSVDIKDYILFTKPFGFIVITVIGPFVNAYVTLVSSISVNVSCPVIELSSTTVIDVE